MTSNFNLNSTSAAGARNRAALLAGTAVHDVAQQRLRILRCTAQAMASSPGGLRFKAGTRPWLDGLGGWRASFKRPVQPLTGRPAARRALIAELSQAPSSGAFLRAAPALQGSRHE